MAQRWLRDVQPCGGVAEVEFLGDGDEVLNQSQVETFDRRNLPIPGELVLDFAGAGGDDDLGS